MGGGLWTELSSLLGVAAILITLVVHLRRRRVFRRAVTGLADVARELGLEHVPSGYPTAQGALRGKYCGYRVNIDPDEARTIHVRFEGQPRVDLRSYRIDMPVPHDMRDVESEDEAFNRYWRTRRASPELADTLFERASADWSAAFRARYASNVRSVIVTSEGVTCEVDFGTPPFIPPDAVRELLDACVYLAAQLEPNAEMPAGAPRFSPAPHGLAAAFRGRVAAFVDFAERRFEVVLGGVALLALACKLWLSLATYGTNDVYAFEQFAAWSRALGPAIYKHAWDFNHPPFMRLVLQGLEGLASASGVFFPFWLRLLPTLADALTLLLVYRLAAPELGRWRTRWGLLLLAASPTLVFVSGFHGNTDSMMLALLMLSVYLTERRASDVGAGVALGLAAGIKLVPLIALPLLFLDRPGWRRRLAFSIALVATIAAWAIPLAWPDLEQAAVQVLGYRGQYGHWGVSWFATQFFHADEGPNQAWRSGGAPLLLSCTALVSYWLSRRASAASSYARIGAVFAFFLAGSNAFGVQYLAWLAPWLVGLPVGPALLYTLASASFALVVYTYWCEGLPWYLADSNRIGDFRGHADYFHLLCWASVLVLCWGYWRRLSAAPKQAWFFELETRGQRQALAFALALLVLLPAGLQVRKDSQRTVENDPAAAIGAIQAKQYISLSAILLQQGRQDEGIEAALRAAALDPGQALAWNNLSAGYMGKADWNSAIDAAERAVRIDPSFQLARNNLAWAREQKAKLRNASAASLGKPL